LANGAAANGTVTKSTVSNGNAAAAVPVARVFEPHYAAGASPFAGLRPTPPRASSFTGTIAAKLNAFAARTGNGAWPNLPRSGIAARLQTLARLPQQVYQDGINACGPALAMYLYAKHKTEQFVELAINLYDNGQGQFGSIAVSGQALTGLDPLSWRTDLGVSAAGEIRSGLPVNEWLLDWMLLASLRRSEDRAHNATFPFEGRPDDGVSGITFPSEMERWLRDGVGFARVSHDTSVTSNKGLDQLRALRPSANRIIVLLINVTVIEGGKKSKGSGIGSRIQRLFPDHYCELEQAITRDSDPVIVWTWGQSGYALPPLSDGDKWEDGFFGAFTCEKT
jgi:hypothetical protein